jgi:hypothetical protein
MKQQQVTILATKGTWEEHQKQVGSGMITTHCVGATKGTANTTIRTGGVDIATQQPCSTPPLIVMRPQAARGQRTTTAKLSGQDHGLDRVDGQHHKRAMRRCQAPSSGGRSSRLLVVARDSDGIEDRHDSVEDLCDVVEDPCDGVEDLCDGVKDPCDGIKDRHDSIEDPCDGVGDGCDGTEDQQIEVVTNLATRAVERDGVVDGFGTAQQGPMQRQEDGGRTREQSIMRTTMIVLIISNPYDQQR